jgi:hypothetical protein
MSGDLSVVLEKLCNLKLRTCGGLFSHLVQYSRNRICIHINSAAVDWRLSYEIPKIGSEISLGDLLSRLPDLHKDLVNVIAIKRYALINEMTYSTGAGFHAKVATEAFLAFRQTYEHFGYTAATDAHSWTILSCNSETFSKNMPLFVHSYVNKTFRVIPSLHLSEPFLGGVRYSQLCITYMVSYALGMLVRYFPTQWIALIQGDKGDVLWPTFNRAQHLVEHSFPELVIEFITDILNGNKFEINDSEEG